MHVAVKWVALMAGWAAVMAGTFAAVAAVGYVSLVVWERAHPPTLPKAPPSATVRR